MSDNSSKSSRSLAGEPLATTSDASQVEAAVAQAGGAEASASLPPAYGREEVEVIRRLANEYRHVGDRTGRLRRTLTAGLIVTGAVMGALVAWAMLNGYRYAHDTQEMNNRLNDYNEKLDGEGKRLDSLGKQYDELKRQYDTLLDAATRKAAAEASTAASQQVRDGIDRFRDEWNKSVAARRAELQRLSSAAEAAAGSASAANRTAQEAASSAIQGKERAVAAAATAGSAAGSAQSFASNAANSAATAGSAAGSAQSFASNAANSAATAGSAAGSAQSFAATAGSAAGSATAATELAVRACRATPGATSCP